MVLMICDMVKGTKCHQTLECFLPNQLLIQNFIARCMITKVIFEYPTDLSFGQPVRGPANLRAAWDHTYRELLSHTDSQQVIGRALVFQPGPNGAIRMRLTMTSVRTLDLGGMFVTHPDAVNAIVTTFAALTDLRFWIDKRIQFPAAIYDLSPLASNLKVLHIHRAKQCPRSGSYHIPADFTTLTKLHNLLIPSSAWLNQADCSNQDCGMLWRLSNDHRTRVAAFLPPNLSHLTMHFAWSNTLFARGEAYLAQFPLLPENVQIRGFEWIKDLLGESGVTGVELVEVPPAKQCAYCEKVRGCW